MGHCSRVVISYTAQTHEGEKYSVYANFLSMHIYKVHGVGSIVYAQDIRVVA